MPTPLTSIRSTVRKLLEQQNNFSSLAVGIVDFNQNKVDSVDLTAETGEGNEPTLFDLASLTKPLTLGVVRLARPTWFAENLEWELLLNHRSGLPSHGRLSKDSWKTQINNYTICESPTVYSDYGALRLMLEIERTTSIPLQEICNPFWSDGVVFWKESYRWQNIPVTGFRRGSKIRGEVNDDNAFLIGEFCSHAGLFGTVQGVGETLLNLNDQLDLLTQMRREYPAKHDRFCMGWDTPTDRVSTLAGSECGQMTFGHLGFTGTSIWIDSERGIGHIILTNATEKYWYDRAHLNELRRTIGNLVWRGYPGTR